VHVAPANPLLVGDHPELLGDLAVSRCVGHRELAGHRWGQRHSQQLGAAGLRGLGCDVAKPGQLLAQFCAVGDDACRGLDLAAGQFQLELDATPRGLVGDRPVGRHRFGGVGIDEQELLFDSDGWMLVHRMSSVPGFSAAGGVLTSPPSS